MPSLSNQDFEYRPQFPWWLVGVIVGIAALSFTAGIFERHAENEPTPVNYCSFEPVTDNDICRCYKLSAQECRAILD